MPKPTPTTRTVTNTYYDYHEIAEHVEDKLGYPLRDTLGSHAHFGTWCDMMGYTGNDPAGLNRHSSQIWYAEYKKHPDGNMKRPPYRDFWHWFLDNNDVENGSILTFSIQESLNELDENVANDEYEEEDIAWVREILECFKAEFGEEIEVLIEW